MRRRIRRLRQLIPTKFATISRPHFPDLPDDHPDQDRPVFVRWWMLWGKCYKVERTPV